MVNEYAHSEFQDGHRYYIFAMESICGNILFLLVLIAAILNSELTKSRRDISMTTLDSSSTKTWA